MCEDEMVEGGMARECPIVYQGTNDPYRPLTKMRDTPLEKNRCKKERASPFENISEKNVA